MDLKSAIDRIAKAADSQAAQAIFKEAHGQPGFSAEYFARVQAAFGADVVEARKLAGYWPQLLRHGDEPALAYRAKGAADRLAGRWLESAKSFIKAGTVASDEREKLSYQVGAVDSLARAGRVSEAVALGRKLSRGLERLGELGLAGRVKLNVGNALLWVDRYRDAGIWLRGAVTALAEGGHSVEAIYAKLGLSTAELYGGSPMAAHTLAEEARREAEEAGLDHTAVMCDLNVAQAATLQGHADEALQILLRLRPLVADSPPDKARVIELLGEVYLTLNLWPEAIDAFEEVLGHRRILPALNVGGAFFGLGRARISAADAAAAIEPLQKASRIFAKAGNLPWSAATDVWRAKAVHERGQSRKSYALASSAAAQARQGRSPWYEAEALLTAAECGVATNEDIAAHLRRAARLIDSNGYQSLRWRVPALRGALAPSGRRLQAHRKTFEAILQNRLLTSSPVSRSAYLRDKGNHISAYLAELLAKPTPGRVREAVEAVARSRSAALIDEMLSSSAAALKPEQAQQLELLRAELQSLEVEAHQPNNSRRGAISFERVSALQRRWIEATHRLLTPAAAPSAVAEDTAVILARAGNDFYALKEGTATRLGILPTELERQLQWIRFELLAPMADRSADPAPALSLIEDLACKLVAPWYDSCLPHLAICPEDQLWQVPWTTLLAALGEDCEPILALHPTLTKISDFRADSGSKAMIWVHRSCDLYHAGEEEHSFLQKFPNAVVCRTASEARESLNEEVDILHVICHAKHNVSNPMFSALLFGDGGLYAAEIARSNFRSKVVSLSACDTGNVNVALRDEPDGLARAFLARGAETVIGSLWPLDDEAAARIYGTLYDSVSGGVSLIEALKQARCAARDWNPHPYFWGALVLFGGYKN